MLPRVTAICYHGPGDSGSLPTLDRVSVQNKNSTRRDKLSIWFAPRLPGTTANMKKCQQCSKPAVLHVTEIRDGGAQAVHLCENCAQDYLGSSDESDDPAEDLAEKIGKLTQDDDLDDMDGVECTNCGVSFTEFRAKGRLSCPQCYESFGPELISLLENIHSETEHKGKYPRRNPGNSEQHYRLIKLRNDLRKAVDAEDYEVAASLRDEIQAVESDLAN